MEACWLRRGRCTIRQKQASSSAPAVVRATASPSRLIYATHLSGGFLKPLYQQSVLGTLTVSC